MLHHLYAHSTAADIVNSGETSAAPFFEFVDTFSSEVKVARWVIRDDNHQHHHGIVSASETPFFIELRWKPSADGVEQLVGRYRLRLPELLAADYIRFEREGEVGDAVRLRFYRGPGGVVYIQARNDRPALKVGSVALHV